jgi:hypothetical protein
MINIQGVSTQTPVADVSPNAFSFPVMHPYFVYAINAGVHAMLCAFNATPIYTAKGNRIFAKAKVRKYHLVVVFCTDKLSSHSPLKIISI